eukprot:TRINITY_DN67371_c2_g2_i1.p1 TRINITY_DN67371_c2_g2~~TRINITY_DN67371_c2_g2_i1.p1  ORF type:complete len:678 (-),score=353.39 TRINITY_DN67371_c2_g2_i1:150-2183(-)
MLTMRRALRSAIGGALRRQAALLPLSLHTRITINSYNNSDRRTRRWFGTDSRREVEETMLVTTIVEALGKDMSSTITIDADASVATAARLMHSHMVGGLLVTSEDYVAGIMTDRDILRALGEMEDLPVRAGTAGEGVNAEEMFEEEEKKSERVRVKLGKKQKQKQKQTQKQIESDRDDKPGALHDIKVRQIMTPASRIVYADADDTAHTALALLLERGIRHLPVRHGSNILCLINIRDIIQAQQNLGLLRVAKSGGAKEDYLRDVLPRVGLSNVSISKGAIERDPLCLHAAAAYLPHPEKEKHGGEDAHFVLSRAVPRTAVAPVESGDAASADDVHRDPVVTVMGVADGVGSWSFEAGVDVGKFSRGLMQYCERFANAYIDKQINQAHGVDMHRRPLSLSPWRVFNTAWREMTRTDDMVGSTTLCVLTLDWHTWHVRATNVGDSGFLILREPRSGEHDKQALGSMDLTFRQRVGHSAQIDEEVEATAGPVIDVGGWEVVHRSRQQLEDFNQPFQIGRDAKGRTQFFESPADADNYALPVRPGDVIVLGTDGLFDNMSEDEIMEVVRREIHLGPHQVARQLAATAKDYSLDRMRDGPFAIMAKDNGTLWSGGRPDDITVLVAVVKNMSDQNADTLQSTLAAEPAADSTSISDAVWSKHSTIVRHNESPFELAINNYNR